MVSPQPISSSDGSSAASAWDAYRAWPVRQVHIERIIACFDGAIEKTAALKLRESHRFGSRLEEMLRQHFNLSALEEPAPADPADELIATLSSDDLMQLATLSGMIRRAYVFAGEIRSSVVQGFSTQFGEDNVRFAIANRDLALKAEATSASEDLQKLIARDGNICLSAWLSTQSDSIQAWTRMKTAHDGVFPAIGGHERIAMDSEIVRRAAMAIFGPEPKENLR
jgi:hypothetical protein